MTLRSLLPLVGVLLVMPLTAAPPVVTATFDDNALTELRRGPVQVIKNGTLVVGEIFFADEQGKDVPADRSNPTISFERTAQRVSYSWPWGAVRCRYTVAGSRLNMELTVENDTAGPMSSVDLRLMELQFPRRPAGQTWELGYPMIGDNNGELTACVADYGTGVLVFCNDDPASAIRSGIDRYEKPPHETWNVIVRSPDYTGDSKPFVGPRSKKTFHFSLRFAEPKVPLKAIIPDLDEKFAVTYPFQLKWPDRRPIGMITLASNGHVSTSNPRGWLSDENLNFVGPAGIKRFREKMLEAADRCIANLKDMGAQGMIFWDIEGEEFSNINYVGDPRMTAKLAPEMEAIEQEFFARFHKAGLRTGVCLRPSKIVPGWDKKSKWQHDNMGFDVVEEMSKKITYAKKRLGCLLYYVDSNVRWFFRKDGSAASELLETAAFKRLADAHPDVLLIPEIPRTAYWSCTAPYQELRPGMFGDHAATDERVRQIYPKAFSVINPIDGPAVERRAELVAGQRRGDILLFRSWFGDEQNKVFKGILREALKKE